MNTRIKIIGFTLLIIVLIVVGIILGRGTNTTNGSPPVVPAPQAQQNDSFVQPPKVVFSYTKTPTIPNSLPTYQFQVATRTSVEQLAQAASSSLGLQTTPSSLQMTDTYTKTWARPNQAQLVVTQTKKGVTLSFQQIIIQKGAPTQKQSDAATVFISLFFTSTQGVSIQQTGVLSGPFEGLLVLDPPSPPEYKEYNFQYTLGGYPVTTESYNNNPASVIVDSAGNIRSANIVPPPSSVTLGEGVLLLTPSQILSNLSSGKGTIVSSYSSQNPLEGIAPSFSVFTIDNTQIVYSPQNDQLLPALLLSGTGTAQGGATQKAVFFLWAYPSVESR